jgi:hypothetical protein
VLLAVVAGASVFGVVSAVQAAIPDANGVVHGCYIPQGTGPADKMTYLRVIDTDKVSGCNAHEASVDLASTGYVQSFVQDTTIMFKNDQGTIGAGNYQLNNSCPAGWIGFDAGASADTAAGNLNLAPHAKWNHGVLATGTPDSVESYTFTVSASTHVITNGACVRAATVGLAPVHGAPTAKPTATLEKIN